MPQVVWRKVLRHSRLWYAGAVQQPERSSTQGGRHEVAKSGSRPSLFRWPRGRYNGRRIGGFTLKLDVNLLHWSWVPRCSRPSMVRLSCTAFVRWLCVGIWVEPYYEMPSVERMRREGLLRKSDA